VISNLTAREKTGDRRGFSFLDPERGEEGKRERGKAQPSYLIPSYTEGDFRSVAKETKRRHKYPAAMNRKRGKEGAISHRVCSR